MWRRRMPSAVAVAARPVAFGVGVRSFAPRGRAGPLLVGAGRYRHVDEGDDRHRDTSRNGTNRCAPSHRPRCSSCPPSGRAGSAMMPTCGPRCARTRCHDVRQQQLTSRKSSASTTCLILLVDVVGLTFARVAGSTMFRRIGIRPSRTRTASRTSAAPAMLLSGRKPGASGHRRSRHPRLRRGRARRHARVLCVYAPPAPPCRLPSPG